MDPNEFGETCNSCGGSAISKTAKSGKRYYYCPHGCVSAAGLPKFIRWADETPSRSYLKKGQEAVPNKIANYGNCNQGSVEGFRIPIMEKPPNSQPPFKRPRPLEEEQEREDSFSPNEWREIRKTLKTVKKFIKETIPILEKIKVDSDIFKPQTKQ
jgi:hypothetical protein